MTETDIIEYEEWKHPVHKDLWSIPVWTDIGKKFNRRKKKVYQRGIFAWETHYVASYKGWKIKWHEYDSSDYMKPVLIEIKYIRRQIISKYTFKDIFSCLQF